MNAIILPCSVCALMFAPCCASAAVTLVFDQLVNTTIPDNDDNGLVSIISVPASGQAIISVEVDFQSQNGWNGDLYAYLEHDGVLSLLLNRPGRTNANPAGAGSSGMQLHFADAAPGDVHTDLTGTFGALATGTYQPDARAADPDLVTDASDRTKFLSGFAGQTADGDWTLFVANLSAGDVATLSSWTVSITVVPEPDVALLASLGLLALWRRRRHA